MMGNIEKKSEEIKAVSKGGKRDGAGRKPGTPNKKTAEATAKIEASGLTPLDFMLSVLRDEAAPMENRCWAAEKAAPYVHAKLASVEHTGKDGEAIRIVLESRDQGLL